MMSIWLVVVILIETVMTRLYGNMLPAPCCSSKCRCTQTPTQITADCSEQSLTIAPVLCHNVTKVDLSYNNIVKFPAYRSNLPNITFIDISNNQLENFDYGNTTGRSLGLSKLVYLNVSNNYIPLSSHVYFKSLFMNMTKLTILDLSNNCDKFEVHCIDYPDKSLQQLVSLQTLNVDVISNHHRVLKHFMELPNLQSLKLSNNRVLGEFRIERLFFKNLHRLKNLDISNCHVHFIETGALEFLQHLRFLDISNNKCLGWCGFKNVTTDLHHTSIQVLKANHLHEHNSVATRLFIQDVKPLNNTNLKELYLNYNNLDSIELGSFEYFPRSLQRLEARDNRLTLNFYMCGHKDLVRHLMNLSTIDVSRIDVEDEFRSEQSQYCSGYTELINCCMCQRRQMNWKATRFSNGAQLWLKDNTTSFVSSLTKNDQILTKQKFAATISYHLHKGQIEKCNECSDGRLRSPWSDIFPLPPNLKMLILVNIQIRNFASRDMDLWFSSNSLKTLNISNNGILQIKCTLYNVSQIENLDLSYNKCRYIATEFFVNFGRLLRLNMSHNQLDEQFNSNSSCTLFQGLGNLQHLHLSHNMLTCLQKCVFQGLKSLKTIDLSSNRLTSWTASVSELIFITLIDLTKNEIQFLENDAVHLLKAIDKRAKIHLAENPFACICEAIPFLTWVPTKSYHCFKSKQTLKYALDELNFKCKTKPFILALVACLVTVAITSIIIQIIKVNKWRLIYWFYLGNKNKKKFRDGYDEIRDYKYDAYISYCLTADVDKEFVNEMINKYENDESDDNSKLKLCIPDRDFIPGCSIAHILVNAIHHSRKVLYVISKYFYDSEWGMYEFYIGITECTVSRKGHGIIVILSIGEVCNTTIPDVIYKSKHININHKVPKNKNDWSRFLDNMKKRHFRT